MINYKPILVVAGEPNSIFIEILIKSLIKEKFKSPIILICSKKLFTLQMKKLNLTCPFEIINSDNLNPLKLNFNKINIIDINYSTTKAFQKISGNSNKYIRSCFEVAINLIKKGLTNKLINGPISKKSFLKKNFLGITEYLAKKTNSKNYAMLIYNKKLSVCPITTHLPINHVAKTLSKKLIIEKILLINEFYVKYFNYSPRIAVTGINPHCETVNNYDEDKEIVKPAVKFLKKKIKYRRPNTCRYNFFKK